MNQDERYLALVHEIQRLQRGLLEEQAYREELERQIADLREAAAGEPGASATDEASQERQRPVGEPGASATGGVPWRIALFVMIIAGFLAWRFWPEGRRDHDPAAMPREAAPRGDFDGDEQGNITVYEKASRSVVNITTVAARRDFFSLNVEQVPRGAGSGFVWDEQGRIVTNYHVIQDAVRGHSSIRVTLADNTTWNARIVGVFPDKDLAVLAIDAPKHRLFPIAVGESHNLKVGQRVYAIGNPFGLDQTMTTGIISALNREIESVNKKPIKGVIQTSAAINPGNSGGPLLDSAGRLIGVNTAIVSPSGVFAGVGFAIPVDEVNRVVPELIRHGQVTRPGLGVQILPDQRAKQLGIEGVLILDVNPDSPAAKAGLRPTRRDAAGNLQLGDVIVAIDDNPIRQVKDLFLAMENYKIGDTISVEIRRDDRTMKVSVTLEALP